MSRAVQPVRQVRAEAGEGTHRISWAHTPPEPLIDHYAVYGAPGTSDVRIGADTLLGRTLFSHFDHVPERTGSPWAYRVVSIDAAGSQSQPSERALLD